LRPPFGLVEYDLLDFEPVFSSDVKGVG